jgi:hypothetical protein
VPEIAFYVPSAGIEESSDQNLSMFFFESMKFGASSNFIDSLVSDTVFGVASEAPDQSSRQHFSADFPSLMALRISSGIFPTQCFESSEVFTNSMVFASESLARSIRTLFSRDSIGTTTPDLLVVVGTMAGIIILFVTTITLIICTSKSTPSSSDIPSLQPPSLEIVTLEDLWGTVLGVEMENPIAQTMPSVGFSFDEA